MKAADFLFRCRSIPAVIAFLLLAALPRPGAAAVSAWDTNEQVDTRLVSATEAVGNGDTVSLGLQFKLRPGWKIYWRTPGDAGYPPKLDWTGSENLKSAVLSWPTPKRFSIFGLETLGYKDEVVLPLTVTLARPGEALRLKAKVSYLSCKDICIPQEAVLAFDLPRGLAAPGPEAGLIGRFAALVPGTNRDLSIERTVLLTGGKDPVVQIEARSTRAFTKPDLYVEYLKAPKEVVFGKPKVRLIAGGRRAVLEIKGYGGDPGALNGAKLAFTLVDGKRAIETVLPVNFGAPIKNAPGRGSPLSIWYVLALALLGGLILNLMPCVLPVLSIKLLSVVGHGGGEARTVRISFIATAAGVVASMLAIAGTLIGVKMAGYTVGWGIQFQQPVFLAIMTVIVTLFAFNLFGLFEIFLPHRVSNLVSKAGSETSPGGHFLTGAFVTLLATPCSAPFLGTAVGFALSRDTPEILAVFAALGIGLAVPYLAVAAVPRLVVALPRPGRWMVVLRHVMGVALLATSVWLLSVIAAQLDLETAAILAALLAVAGSVLVLKRLPGSRLGRHAGFLVAGLALAVIVLPGFRTPGDIPAGVVVDGRWQPFDPVEIRRVVDAGGVVFVDVTADWCITCQVNKKLVLDQGAVSEWLGGDAVVAMRADWTRPSPAISKFLASFERYGIPFNVVYGPKVPEGVVLPEILTSAMVLDAVKRATGAAVQTVAK